MSDQPDPQPQPQQQTMEAEHDQVAQAALLAKRLRMRANRQPGLTRDQRLGARQMAVRLEQASGAKLLALGRGLPTSSPSLQTRSNPTASPDGLPRSMPTFPKLPQPRNGSGRAKMPKPQPAV